MIGVRYHSHTENSVEKGRFSYFFSKTLLKQDSVVQRQLWLLKTQDISPERAYDQARKEFYALRLQEDVERRVAKEEALATGAHFGKSALDIGMELEDKEYERWRSWAKKELVERHQRRFASSTGGDENAIPQPDAVDSADADEDEAV